MAGIPSFLKGFLHLFSWTPPHFFISTPSSLPFSAQSYLLVPPYLPNLRHQTSFLSYPHSCARGFIQYWLRYQCLKKAMAPHSSTIAWKIPWMEEPGGLQSMESWRVGHDWETSLSRIREGNGNPLQCTCLENPRDSGAWWAAIYGIAWSRTWLKRLSSSSSSSSSSRYQCH